MRDGAKCDTFPCLIFEDEFNTFDMLVWEHLNTAAATGNNEFQYYTNNRTNSFVKNGILYLKPTLTNDTYDDEFVKSGTLDLWGNTPYATCTSNQYSGCLRKGSANSIVNPIQSASIRTVQSFSFKYGKIETKAKIPNGDWLWPAVWLMPKYNIYGEWPASGEIDLLESRGNDELRSDDKAETLVGNQRVSQCLHWGPFYQANSQMKTAVHTNKKSGSYADEYHLYSIEWGTDGMVFFIDDKATLNITVGKNGFWEFGEFDKNFPGVKNPWESGSSMAPFDQHFYIIMNLAVGGTKYFFDTQKPRPPWDNDKDGDKAMKDFWEARDQWYPTWKGDDTALKIDYIKVWKLDSP